jgi:hypothetical protein
VQNGFRSQIEKSSASSSGFVNFYKARDVVIADGILSSRFVIEVVVINARRANKNQSAIALAATAPQRPGAIQTEERLSL